MQKYSVLMTVYTKDNPGYFALSLDSMLRQTYLPDEIILVKDGLITDELQSVINNRKGKDVPIREVQLKENRGLGLALNTGIKYCRNDLIARMDSDDFSMPLRCELQIKEFDKNPELDIIGCQVDEFIENIDNIVGSRTVPLANAEIYKFAKKRDPFNHPTVMYRKSTLEKIGCYSDYRKNQDTDLWIRMLRSGAVCKNLNESLLRFRFDEGTYKKRKSWMNTKSLIEIRYKAWRCGFNSFPEFLMIAVIQMGVYVLPVGFQRFLYKKILRR